MMIRDDMANARRRPIEPSGLIAICPPVYNISFYNNISAIILSLFLDYNDITNDQKYVAYILLWRSFTFMSMNSADSSRHPARVAEENAPRPTYKLMYIGEQCLNLCSLFFSSIIWCIILYMEDDNNLCKTRLFTMRVYVSKMIVEARLRRTKERDRPSWINVSQSSCLLTGWRRKILPSFLQQQQQQDARARASCKWDEGAHIIIIYSGTL